MGMYTEIFVNVDFRKDAPTDVINIISEMCGDIKPEKSLLDGKPERWRWLFHNGSFYTPNTECAKLTRCDISGQWSLLAKGDIKNYKGEIEAFFDFIAPWVDGPCCMGWSRYEESDEPTLHYTK